MNIEARFQRFHENNPEVFAELERLTNIVVDNGIQRIGIELLMNQIRWNSMLRTRGDVFKINQNYASRYSRLLVAEHPEWDGLFEFRKLRSKTAVDELSVA